MGQGKPQASGLKWRRRASGVEVPYFVADEGRTAVSLKIHGIWNGTEFVGNADALTTRCNRLHVESRMQRDPSAPPVFDGLFAAMFDIYRHDPESTFRGNKPGTQRLYDQYLPKLKKHIGKIAIEDADGRHVKKWFRDWAGVEDLRDPAAHLARAHVMLAVLKAAIRFGKVCKYPCCIMFMAVLEELEFPAPPPRTMAPTANRIIAIRKAAHVDNAPLRALCYALQYETGLRAFDLIGEWVPLSYHAPSLILRGREKWIGPMWSNIDANLILHAKPTKTADTTGVEGDFDLTACPMVMEELAKLSGERSGPLIVHESTGLPYVYQSWRTCWRRDFEAAGLPKTMWNRDLRRGGSTEASKAGVSKEDRAKLNMHSEEVQAKVYDADMVETHRRAMAARRTFRERQS